MTTGVFAWMLCRIPLGMWTQVPNIDFEAWADYLGDAPLAMALLDRVVDGATIVKLKGKSYRVHRTPEKPSTT